MTVLASIVLKSLYQERIAVNLWSLCYRELIINEQEAAVVRRVFAEYLAGKSPKAIDKGLRLTVILTAQEMPCFKRQLQWVSHLISFRI